MRQFSWLTGDTGKSITNRDADEGALPVYLILPDDTYIYEDNYGGYGVFGGRDFYGLVWQLNSDEKPKAGRGKVRETQAELCEVFDETNRGKGISLAYREENMRGLDVEPGPPVILPRFAEKLVPWASLPDPVCCPNQGFGRQEESEDE